jgi:hypothetical protein
MNRLSLKSLALWIATLLLASMTLTGCDIFDSNGGGGGGGEDDGGGDNQAAAPVRVYMA